MNKKIWGVDGQFGAILQRLFIVILLAFATLQGPPANAQTYQFSSFVVEGNQRIETGTILTYAGISAGEAVSAAQLNDAIQRIRASGLFESVNAVPQGGRLVIQVVEFPTINRINFEGNGRLKDDELKAVIRSQERRVYSPAQTERDVAAIVDAYVQQGRVNASVTPKIIARSDNRVDLVFEVFEGGVSEIDRISFVGNRQFSDRRLRGVLETKQAGILHALIQRDTFVADRIDFDRQVLTDFYRARGYVDFTVQNVDVALTRERDSYLITFNVQEGQQFRVGEVFVTSDLDDVDPFEFEQALRLRPGTVYSPQAVDVDIARLERLALRKGLNFIRVDPRVTRNDRALTLDLEFALTRGPRIFVERIDIEGNTTTLDRVVRSQFKVVEGDPFNPREIRESAQRIRALGLFANADVNAREGSSPSQVVIDVDVQETPTGSLSFGGNYNSENGFSVLASYKERNFMGRGQNLEFQLSTAESNRQLTFSFNEPRFLGRDLGFGLNLSYKTTNNENAVYDTEVFRLTPNFSFPLSANGRLAVYYTFEYTDITDVGATAGTIISDESALGGLGHSSLGYSYSFDTRRSGLNPNAGVLLRFGQEFGLGDTSFIKTTASATAETKVLNEEVTLRAVIEGGMLNYSEGDSRVTDRFFLGSGQMRGFTYGGIGPRERDGTIDNALGGNKYAVVRLEAEFPLGLPEEYGMHGGAFVDYGSVWDAGSAAAANPNVIYNDFTPRTVVGLSLFWTTPIGPLRFNFSRALDAQQYDDPKNFDLTISTSF